MNTFLLRNKFGLFIDMTQFSFFCQSGMSLLTYHMWKKHILSMYDSEMGFYFNFCWSLSLPPFFWLFSEKNIKNMSFFDFDGLFKNQFVLVLF